ncbi:MAG: hypothetical protein ILO68_01270, partial [Clostridia bacterium]|nr:hypothetical protein [Clostridia bacterium]
VTITKETASRTWERVFWGIVFLAAAVLIILYAAGVNLGVIGEIPVIDLILGVILLAWIIRCLIRVRIPSIFLPLGLLFCVFEEEIARWAGIADFQPGRILNHWLVLLVIVLLTAGSALLLRPWTKKRKEADSCRVTTGGSSTLYIDCVGFSEESVKNELGSTSVWFSNKDRYEGNGVLHVHNELGSTTVHVPPEWHLSVNVTKELGNVSVCGSGNPEGKLLTIVGKCELGNVSIRDDG